jgi:hypothetical protein
VSAIALRVGAGAAGPDKVFAPFKGTVGYKPAKDAPFTRVVGKIPLPDNSYAVTQDASLATLTLPDSSQVAIGERTEVQVGAFNDATATSPTTLTVDHGALRFAVVHPAGQRSNYLFQTQTSQIAVRGTIGYLITAEHGTQLICIDCAPGDVEITIDGKVVELLSGHTITIVGSPGSETYTITPNDTSYNPAIAQFLLLLPHPDFVFTGGGSDPTGYLLGASHGGAALLPILAEAGAVGAIVASTSGGGSTPSPTPTPQPEGSASPTPTPTPTPLPTYGPLYVYPTSLTFTSVGGAAQQFTVQQTGPATGTIAIAQPNCNGDGAAATDTPNSVPVGGATTPPTVINVNAVAAPTSVPPPTHACQILVTGGNGATMTVTLDITATSITVNAVPRPTAAPATIPGIATPATSTPAVIATATPTAHPIAVPQPTGHPTH